MPLRRVGILIAALVFFVADGISAGTADRGSEGGPFAGVSRLVTDDCPGCASEKGSGCGIIFGG